MIKLLLVGIGGFFGAAMRFTVSKRLNGKLSNGFPLGTITVNIIGSFLVGILSQAALSENLRLFFVMGFIGSLTTFSTFVLETKRLSEQKNYLDILYVLLSIAGGVGGVILGMKL